MYVPRNVLLIDDDPIICEIAKSYFETLGAANVQTAADGNRALLLLRTAQTKIDFILCDLNMPELDGIQLLSQLAETGFDGFIAIVSGEEGSVIETAKTIAEVNDLKIAGVMQKPLRLTAMERLLASCETQSAPQLPDDGGAPEYFELETAIAEHQIVPYYLPTVDMKTGAITGVEALARWHHPQRGMVMPDSFIPLAEKNGLIDGLTSAMARQSLSDLVAWRNDGLRVGMAINLTSVLLEDKTLPDHLLHELAQHGIEPEALTLEVTERILLKPTPAALEVLARLRIKGFNLAIDDFGIGFSNIEQLRRFPYSKLKVDRSFIQGATADRFAVTGLKASIMLGRELNMTIVAEGVAGLAEWQMAREHGADEAQGFWIAEPMPAETFRQWYLDNDGVMPAELCRQAHVGKFAGAGAAKPVDPFDQEAPAGSRRQAGS
jgi:EAL domain-containing protein (putative c-di-GMP-specific phosphodiesterase class I)